MNSPKPHRKFRFWLGLLGLLALILVITHFIVNANRQAQPKGQIVVLGKVTSTNAPVYLSALGTVKSDESITLKTEVNGQLLKVYFQDGQKVKAGELLAEIDPRPFQAQVLQFEGQLARDQALLANAHIDLKRYKTLYKLNSVAQQTLATQKSLVKQLEGTIKIDQGQLDAARVNLGFCKLTSPITGRIGIAAVKQGDYIQTSDANGIAVINSFDPITVIFSLPEDDVSKVAGQIYAGKKLSTLAYDRTQTMLLATGTVANIDNQIDPTTGTVKLKAYFPNKDEKLFPNQFVNIKVLINTLNDAAVVPTAAIQQGVNGPFVYLVNPAHQTVSVKAVKPGVTDGEYTTVTHSLMPGQSVVLEGADKLTDGAKITVSSGKTAA